MIEFRLEETVNFENYIQQRGDALVIALRDRVNQIDAVLQRSVVANLSGAVLQIRTGKAVRSVEMIPAELNGDLITGAVQAGGGAAPYLKIQEEGSAGPYEIVPDRAKALAFMLNGRMVFARKVIHPGLPARRPVGQAVDGWISDARASLQAVPSEVAAQ